ncbi:MAG: bifunctional DNA primase/polymerase, partial [Candidatus Bathyarchaeia archaeon]
MNTQLLAAAETYHNLGLAILPFVNGTDGKKHPYCGNCPDRKWEQWQIRPQTKEEFSALHIEEYGMFGVVCGTPLTVEGETTYLAGVDRDVKDPAITDETKQRTLQTINQMPTTKREKTRSGGNHSLYYSKKPVKGKKLNGIGMELLGAGNLMVMAPSEGYTKENDNPITVVDDAEALFYGALENADLYKKPTETPHKPTTNLKEARPCITEALKQQLTGGNGHLMRLAIAAEYKRLGYTTEQIIELFKAQKDFDSEESLKGVNSAKPELAANCNSIKEYGYCLNECPLMEADRQRTDQLRAFSVNPKLQDYLLADLEKTIKFDRPVKLVSWYTGVSAMGHNPLNTSVKGESGVGKTYNVVTTLSY